MRQGDLTKLVDQVIKGERLIHGQVTERVERKVDLSGLSPEELAVLDKVILAQESED
jgi:hypothetical protein